MFVITWNNSWCVINGFFFINLVNFKGCFNSFNFLINFKNIFDITLLIGFYFKFANDMWLINFLGKNVLQKKFISHEYLLVFTKENEKVVNTLSRAFINWQFWSKWKLQCKVLEILLNFFSSLKVSTSNISH